MFLRPYKRYKDGKTHTYYAVVESVRTEAGPRQHVVAYLGELNRDQERRWQRTLVCYNRQGDVRQLRLFPDDEQIPLPDDPDVVRIRLSSVGRTNARSFGDVWLARWLWNWLHLDEIVARHLPQGRETVAPADIVAIEVINRLCGPCSEFALAEHWYASTGLEDLLGVPDREVTKDRLYRTLDDLVEALKRLERQVVSGRLKKRDKILERVGRLKERFPKARPFVTITVSESPCQLQWIWDVPKFKAALARDGVSLMSTNHDGWTPTEFWETYMQLTTVENAFRVLKSHLLLRPVWRHYAGRTKAHVFICVLAYTLWSTLAQLARRAGLVTLIHKPDPEYGSASPQPRPMTPEVILRELAKIKIGDILLETTEGQKLALRRVARPDPEQARILTALNLQIPERLTADSICSEDWDPGN